MLTAATPQYKAQSGRGVSSSCHWTPVFQPRLNFFEMRSRKNNSAPVPSPSLPASPRRCTGKRNGWCGQVLLHPQIKGWVCAEWIRHQTGSDLSWGLGHSASAPQRLLPSILGRCDHTEHPFPTKVKSQVLEQLTSVSGKAERRCLEKKRRDLEGRTMSITGLGKGGCSNRWERAPPTPGAE